MNHDNKTKFLNKITQILERFYKSAIRTQSNSTTLVIDGHFPQVDFDPILYDRRQLSFEYIQLIRECKHRRHSWFMYALFNSVQINKIRTTNDKYIEASKMLKLNLPGNYLQTIKACFKN